MLGRVISHYKIIDKIGEGGMGVVYKAEDTKLQRVVALKFLPPKLLVSATERDRFFQEARAAAALDNPNICTVHEIDTVDDETFIAMAYVPGASLSDRIAKGPMPLEDALTFTLQLCGALEEAHSKGVIHRDIKPANVVISQKGHAVLMDFGLAKLHGQSHLTQTGTTVGTVAYMSPEQARGTDVDHRSDIWSLGVVLYEMIAGRRPFRGDHQAALFYSIANETPPPVTSLRSDVPIELERVLTKALAKDPAERYQSAADMRVDLKAVLKSLTGHASGAGPPPTSPVIGSRRRWLVPAVVVAFVVVVAAAVMLLRGRAGGPAAPPAGTAAVDAGAVQNSIAVLPLENFSRDDKNEFFVDGMTEELITQLARIRSLKVISRTSVMRYKNTEKPLGEIAKDLNVAKVLEGSVLWAGDRVRITVQLIDGATDQHIWANSYESDLKDVLGLQREVARAVASEIQAELTPQEEAELARSPVVNSKAHELYLQGRFYWNKRTPDMLRKALEYFEAATKVDPTYAEAYAGMADTYVVLASWDFSLPTSETYPKARSLAEHALELDPTLAEAHATLGGIAHEYDREWDHAEEHFRRAIELNPNYATGHQWYGEFLTNMGRFDEALAEFRRAYERDPLSLIINYILGYAVACDGDEEASTRYFDRARTLDPTFVAGDAFFRAITALALGRYDDFARQWCDFEQRSAETDAEKTDARKLLQATEQGGPSAFYHEFIRQRKEWRKTRYVSAVRIADLYALSGEADSALAWLEQGIKEHATEVAAVGTNPALNGLESDPRFITLLERLDLSKARERYIRYRSRH